jgi:hypothetical protein
MENLQFLLLRTRGASTGLRGTQGECVAPNSAPGPVAIEAMLIVDPLTRDGHFLFLSCLLYRAASPRFIAGIATRRSLAAKKTLPARLGAHQPNRRLPVEGQEASTSKIQVTSNPKYPLARFIVRF